MPNTHFRLPHHETLLAYVATLPIIDTHEHLPAWERNRKTDIDFFHEYLSHYFSCDLRSAGLSKADLERTKDRSIPLLERWDLVESAWENARHTGYGRSLDLAAKGIYGIPHINRSTVEELNERFRDALKPGHFRRVLTDLSGIEVSILDSAPVDHDPSLFVSVHRLDRFIIPQDITTLEGIERDVGFQITSFDGWLAACKADLERVLTLGVVGLKCGLAYVRSLHFQRRTRAEAEASFNAFLADRQANGWSHPRPARAVSLAFEDYMMHYIMGLANERKLVFKFHTGIQEGNGNILNHSRPELLCNLFLEYPDVRFNLLHMSYPFQHIASALAKNNSNVYLDMCWGHIISPTASVHAVVEWLDAVPANKISAFGGDYCFVDGVYGHSVIARENIAKAMAIKVNDGVFDVERAKVIARMLLYDNPKRLYALDPPHSRKL